MSDGNQEKKTPLVISQATYERLYSLGINYSGFVEGVGYVLPEVVVTAKRINKSGTEFMFNIHNFDAYVFPYRDLGQSQHPQTSATMQQLASDTPSSGVSSADIQTGIGIALGTGSLGTEMKLYNNNYTYLKSLADQGKYIAINQYGVEKVMDKSYESTKRMRALLQPQKAQFLTKVNKLGWVKGAGWLLSGAGIGISGYQLYYAETDLEKLESGIDTGMGVVGLLGPLGAAASLNYSLQKPFIPYYIEYNIERGERMSRGDYSMLWWRPGQSVR